MSCNYLDDTFAVVVVGSYLNRFMVFFFKLCSHTCWLIWSGSGSITGWFDSSDHPRVDRFISLKLFIIWRPQTSCRNFILIIVVIIIIFKTWAQSKYCGFCVLRLLLGILEAGTHLNCFFPITISLRRWSRIVIWWILLTITSWNGSWVSIQILSFANNFF